MLDPELVGKTLRLADAFDLERDGVHRLLEVVKSSVGQLRRHRTLPSSPWSELPSDEPDDEKRDVQESVGPFTHRDGVPSACYVDDYKERGREVV